MFGSRTLGSSVNGRSDNLGSAGTPGSRLDQQSNVGQITGSERFLRDSRTAGQFVGSDSGEDSFVGALSSGGSSNSSMGGRGLGLNGSSGLYGSSGRGLMGMSGLGGMNQRGLGQFGNQRGTNRLGNNGGFGGMGGFGGYGWHASKHQRPNPDVGRLPASCVGGSAGPEYD